jgi:hypothetical protein
VRTHPHALPTNGAFVGTYPTNAPFVGISSWCLRPGLQCVEIVFTNEQEARAYARDRSRDWRITSAGVTRFTVGELGTRCPVGWYIDGAEQREHWNRQLYPTDGPTGT